MAITITNLITITITISIHHKYIINITITISIHRFLTITPTLTPNSDVPFLTLTLLCHP